MCQMLQLPQTAEKRQELRNDMSEFLLERLETPWMHDLMVATCELTMKRSSKPACSSRRARAWQTMLLPHPFILSHLAPKGPQWRAMARAAM